jgi:hypothetical protein
MKILSCRTSPILLITSFVSLIAYIYSYSFSADELIKNPNCASTVPQQSPVNLISQDSVYYDETTFRITNVNYTISANATWKSFSTEKAIGFEEKFGSLIFIRNWSQYKFDLQKILFRYKSSHRVNGQYYDAEIQFIHKLDTTYHPAGRYIEPNVNYLVYSVFLLTETDPSETYSKFLEYLDINKLASNSTGTSTIVNPTKDIKLGHLVRPGNQLLYDGRLEFSTCDKAWVVIEPKYQLITPQELENLRLSIKKFGYITDTDTTNVRNIQALVQGTTVYRNTDKAVNIIQTASNVQFTKVDGLKMSLFVFFIIVTALLFI